MIPKKIKAGAMQFTMFLVVVVALLLAAFIILVNTQKQFKIKTAFVKEAVTNADFGIQYTLQNNIILNDTISVNLQDEDFKTLKVHRDYWGVFQKVVSSSTIKKNHFKKVALVGTPQQQKNRTALYVQDNNRPLVIVGKTKIQGVAYLPKQGVRTGNISGHSYYGSQLIYGVTKESSELPKLSKELLENIKATEKRIEAIDQNNFLDLSKNRIHQNSFFNPLQIIYSKQPILLSQVSLVGHILVQSKTKIIVDASSTLKDIVLIAPEIELKDYVKGTFQAIATKEISVGKYCKLNYPSALVLNESTNRVQVINNNENTAFINVSEGTNIKGAIAYFGETKNYKAQVFIDEHVTITGEIFCNKNLELIGDVEGSVYTSNFIANQSGSAYQNHIYNGTISIDKLPEEYVGLAFKDSKKEVAKWLY